MGAKFDSYHRQYFVTSRITACQVRQGAYRGCETFLSLPNLLQNSNIPMVS